MGSVRNQNKRLPPEVNRILYVRNLPYKITSDEMYDIFGKYGAIRQIRVGDAADTRVSVRRPPSERLSKRLWLLSRSLCSEMLKSLSHPLAKIVFHNCPPPPPVLFLRAPLMSFTRTFLMPRMLATICRASTCAGGIWSCFTTSLHA